MAPKELDQIESRLKAFIHWKKKSNESIDETHAPDVMYLISELRKAWAQLEIAKEGLESAAGYGSSREALEKIESME